MYLRVEERSKDCNGSSNGVYGSDRRVEDDNGRYYYEYSLHCVTNAECQWRYLIKRHVRHLIVQVIEHTLSSQPPEFHTNKQWVQVQSSKITF